MRVELVEHSSGVVLIRFMHEIGFADRQPGTGRHLFIHHLFIRSRIRIGRLLARKLARSLASLFACFIDDRYRTALKRLVDTVGN